MDYWNSAIKYIVAVVLTLTIVPYLTAYLASKLGHFSKKMLVNNLGPNSQLLVGGLGVAVHEFGHALFAVVFGHHIDKIQLLNFHYAQTGTLGSVEHSWNERNIYQRLGNFFIGIGPYYMCSIAIYLLQRFLLNHKMDFSEVIASSGDLRLNSFSNIISSVVTNFEQIFSGASWAFILIYFILTTMIASTGYDLSKEDLNTVKQGVIPWVIVLLICSIVAVFLHLQAEITTILSVVIVFSVVFLVQAIIYILISLVLIRIISIL